MYVSVCLALTASIVLATAVTSPAEESRRMMATAGGMLPDPVRSISIVVRLL